MEKVEEIIKRIEDVDRVIPINEKFLTRGGDGVFGNTLEYFLDINENNLSLSDLKNYEIKTKKETSSSKLTLFNKGSRKTNWSIPVNYFKEQFGTGYIDFNIRPNIYNIKIAIENDEIKIIDLNLERVYYKIDFPTIEKVISSKIKNILIFQYKKEKDYFKILKIEEYKNASMEKFIEAIENGNLYVCSNIGSKNHDRGTQYRIKKNKLYSLFETQKVYEWN